MKRLMCLLMMMMVVSYGFAQNNVPNYLQQAKVELKKYYPQYVTYFKPYFDEIDKMEQWDINIMNKKINYIFVTFSDELKTEKDKYTTILMTVEKLHSNSKTFCEAKDVVVIDAKEGYDLREANADVIKDEIIDYLTNKIQKNEELEGKIDIISSKLDNLLNKGTINKEEILEFQNIIEELFVSIENTEFINIPDLKVVFNYYLDFNKKLGREPNDVGKRIIEWVKKNK